MLLPVMVVMMVEVVVQPHGDPSLPPSHPPLKTIGALSHLVAAFSSVSSSIQTV